MSIAKHIEVSSLASRLKEASSFRNAALVWHKFGLQVIPVITGTKKPALPWDPWLNGLCEKRIKYYWGRHPDQELAFIVGPGMVVFDMDSEKASEAMLCIMKKYDTYPSIVVNTDKGCHYYFRLEAGVSIKMDSHSTSGHPERIDVKTGRSGVMLPPSKGKSVALWQAENVGELTCAGQDFVDAIFIHNGRPAPSTEKTVNKTKLVNRSTPSSLSGLKIYLDQIDPDVGYQDWFKAIAAVFHETEGSDEGLDLVDAWSSKGDKYKGPADVEATWRSLRSEHGNPITIATLYSLAVENIEAFERCETVVIYPKPEPALYAPKGSNPFKAFSLKGHQDEILSRKSDQVFCLEGLAAVGQLTVLFSPPNTGKTLLVIKLLTESISADQINGQNVYYLDCDDNVQGLSEKNAIAEEFGFHLLADGWNGFSVSKFYKHLRELIHSSTAHKTILILDTLKKFVDPMSKSDCRNFSRLLRQLVQVGATVVTLAHTNKNRTQSGVLIPAGTSDILDDFDAAYLLDACPTASKSNEKVVTLTNTKKRGNNINEVSYAYTTCQDITYRQLFDSVRVVDGEDVNKARTAGQVEADAKTIEAIKECITKGVNGKMALVEAVKNRTSESNRKIGDCLDRYTGTDPRKHFWQTRIGERGKMTFELLGG